MKKKCLLPIAILALSSLAGCQKQSYNFSEEDYSYMLLSGLVGQKGTLDITKDYATYVNGELEKKLYPTDIKEETITYEKVIVEDIKRTVTENVVTIYYGAARNDSNYRVIFSASEFKLVELQQKKAEEWEVISSFSPSAPEFAGAYNGLGYFDRYNYVHFYGNEFRKDLDDRYVGYEAAMYYNGTFGRDMGLLVPGFYLLSNKSGTTVYKCTNLLDMYDHEFFNVYYVTSLTNENLDYVGSAGVSKDYMYADASMFLTDMVDEDGTRHDNSYTISASGALTQVKVDGQNATYIPKRTENGLIYEFTVGNEKTTVTQLPGKYEFTKGGVTKKFASMLTWYDEETFPCIALIPAPKPLKFVVGDLSNSLSMYYTGIDRRGNYTGLTYAWNDSPISNYKLAANSEGRAVLSFTDSKLGKVVASKGNNDVAIVEYGDFAGYMYNTATLDTLFVDTFINPKDEVSIVVGEDYKVTIGNSAPIQGNFTYLSEYGITMVIGDYYFIPFAYKTDSSTLNDVYFGYVLLNSQTGSTVSTVRAEYLTECEGLFTNDGTHTFSYENYELQIDGVKVNYSLEFLVNQTLGTYTLALSYTQGGNKYYAIYSDKAFTIYDSNFNYYAYYFPMDIFRSLKGNYVYDGELGKEYIRFKEDGKLTLDCFNADRTAIVRDVEASSYSVAATENYISVNATITMPSGSTVQVPMFKEDGAILIGDYIYLEEVLHDLQGIYGDGSSNALLIYQNAIYVNAGVGGGNTKQKIVSLERTNAKDIITTEKYVIEATYNGESLSTLSYYEISEGESSRVNLQTSSNNRDYFEAEYTGLEPGVYSFWMRMKHSISNGRIIVEADYKVNGLREPGTFINGACYYNGHLCVKINHVYTFYCYMENNTPMLEFTKPGI